MCVSTVVPSHSHVSRIEEGILSLENRLVIKPLYDELRLGWNGEEVVSIVEVLPVGTAFAQVDSDVLVQVEVGLPDDAV